MYFRYKLPPTCIDYFLGNVGVLEIQYYLEQFRNWGACFKHQFSTDPIDYFSVWVIGLNYGLCCRKKEGKECCLNELKDQRLTMGHITRLGTIVGGSTIRGFFQFLVRGSLVGSCLVWSIVREFILCCNNAIHVNIGHPVALCGIKSFGSLMVSVTVLKVDD